MKLLAIDPGNTLSAYVVMGEDYMPLYHDKVENRDMLAMIRDNPWQMVLTDMAVEMIASYGMPVGKEVFETCVWIGRFLQAADYIPTKRFVYRKDEKMNLCGSMKAKDSNIICALIDRFAPNVPNRGKGSKKLPGWFYGFSKDVWQAYAVGTTYLDLKAGLDGKV